LTEEFWSARPVLQHVLALARARGVGPWAVLGTVMARGICTIPPTVALPGIVGGRMSLNLFVAAVGPSGGGKGAADAAAMAGFTFAGPAVDLVPLGSGEGIARTFRPSGIAAGQPNSIDTAIFTAPEIDTLAAIAARQGSTLSAELRKVYSGEALGFGNAGKDTRNIVAAGSYRASLILGVQPLRSQPLIGAADGGLPQRFIWMPTSDPDAPDEPPADPGVSKIETSAWNRPNAGHLHVVSDGQDLAVPDVARTAIRAHRLAVLREESTVDPLDGHALLTRLKVAAALMTLEGRTTVDTTDWTLAGYVMDVSTYTRERCKRALIEQYRSHNTARALATADRDEIISERKLQRCKEGIVRALARLAEGKVLAHNQLRRSLKSDVRDYFDAAAAELIADGHISAARTAKGVMYGGPPVDHRSTPFEQPKHGVDRQSTVDQHPSIRRRRERNRTRHPQQTREATG
jgi:hypothetical protein